MKKILSFILASVMLLTAFGVTTALSGVIAGAEFLEYFEYLSIPGFNAFSEAELKSTNTARYEFAGFSSDNMPETAAIDSLAQFKITSPDGWGGIDIWTFNKRNLLNEDSAQWAAKDLIAGKDIFGDSGLTFEGSTGVMFWVSVNGSPYMNEVRLTANYAPSKGPYYSVSEDTDEQDMMDTPMGFCYETSGKYPDSEGYFYFDFKSDFQQVDWWSKDDDGVNQYLTGNTPIPKSKISVLNAFTIRIGHVQTNDIVSIGDFRVCVDTRVHTDELDEQLVIFDSLNPESYTEESYGAASEVYLDAYEVYLNAETQKQVDAAVEALKDAIKSLQPLFHARDERVELVGFDGWSEDDLDNISAAGLDSAIWTEDYAPNGKETSVMVMANAIDGEPTYGWSWFTNGAVDADEVTAIGNPFALVDGSALLSEANGIRFWVKWDESLSPVPTAMRVGVGSSTSSVYFECEDYSLTLPETEGYVGIPWADLYDLEGEADIYDYIDELDYISVLIEGAIGIYYIADLHAFKWDVSEADFEPLQKTVNDTYAYMATLTKDDWYYKSWDRVMVSLAAGEELIGKYGATIEEVQEAIDLINSNISKLVLRRELATAATIAKLEALTFAADTYWRGGITPATYRAMSELNEEAKIMIEEGPSEEKAQAQIVALEAAIKALVPIKAGEKGTTIYSLEHMSVREFNRSDAHRHSLGDYSLANAENVPNIPEGYAKALKIAVTPELINEYEDIATTMTFKTLNEASSAPTKIGKNNENLLMGNLTGTDGVCIWIGVNDPSLIENAEFSLGMSNCTIGPLFEVFTDSIPLPATGHGWIYIPWEYFEIPADWTNGEQMRLNDIFFYIIRIRGIYSEGFEFYATGLHAYTNPVEDEWEAPVIENITDGQTIDLAEGDFLPKWSVGTAEYDNTWFEYGSAVYGNGEHTLTVTNGGKSTSVTFTVVNDKEIIYDVPVVSGAEEGGEYESTVLTWDCGTATLNNKPVESGVEVTEVGEYTLIVTNGNQQVTISFSIIDKPDYIKGDFDGDGEITVADALAALRIAARMAESSDEAIAIGDIDADGEITVADALAILRVAAKMADSL